MIPLFPCLCGGQYWIDVCWVDVEDVWLFHGQMFEANAVDAVRDLIPSFHINGADFIGERVRP